MTWSVLKNMNSKPALHIKDGVYCLVMNQREAHILRTLVGSYCAGPAIDGLYDTLHYVFPDPLLPNERLEPNNLPCFK